VIRLIVRTNDFGAAANVGGPVNVTFQTFDVGAPILEAFLRAKDGDLYCRREVVGVEVLCHPQELGDEAILAAMPDWSSPWDVMAGIGWEHTTPNCNRLFEILDRLVSEGRAAYDKQANLYRSIKPTPTAAQEG